MMTQEKWASSTLNSLHSWTWPFLSLNTGSRAAQTGVCFVSLFYNDSTLRNSGLKLKNRGPWLGKPGLCKRSRFCFVLFEGGRGMLERWLGR